MDIDHSDGMPRVKVTPEMRREMEALYLEKFEKGNRLNSHTVSMKSESRKAGILGELMFQALYPTAMVSPVLAYDFVYKGKRVDVKCKCRTEAPSWSQEASIYAYQLQKRGGDLYYFMSTTPQFEYVWLCGYISRNELLTHPRRKLWHAGEIDSANGKRFAMDTLNLKYTSLKHCEF